MGTDSDDFAHVMYLPTPLSVVDGDVKKPTNQPNPSFDQHVTGPHLANFTGIFASFVNDILANEWSNFLINLF